MSLANIAELIGSSENNWEDAAQVAITEAAKTIHGIRSVEVTADVNIHNLAVVREAVAVTLNS